MDPLITLLLHLLLYGLPPILIVTFFRTFKSTSFFYSYFGFLYVFTQLFAVLYSIKISEDLVITGGNIAYSSIIMITFFIGIASRDPTVVRNLIGIQVFFNFFLFFLYSLLTVVLNDPTTINIFSISSGIFSTTIIINIVSSCVFVLEVLVMFFVLEKIKELFNRLLFVISLFVVVYIAILCLDGFLFPFMVSLFIPSFGRLIVGDIQGKLILGIGFSPFLLAFMFLHKRSLESFMKEPFSIILVILPRRKLLIEKLHETEQTLKESEKKYEEAYHRATFYKDLFLHDISNFFQNIELSFFLLDKARIDKASFNSKKSEDLFKIINNQIIRGKSLISNIRKLAEIDQAEPNLKRMDLFEYLSSAIDFARERDPQKHVEIKVESGDKPIFLNANELLGDIFDNLLINAIKYNENEIPEIVIRITKVEINEINHVKLEFMDNGIGVQDSKKEKIFLEGYKELKGKKGMGIGLSLITKIIKSYKGKIWVENRNKGVHTKGSNFIVLIPEAKSNT